MGETERWCTPWKIRVPFSIQTLPKVPLLPICFEKHTARPIDENVDSVMGLQYAQVSKCQWVVLECGRECALNCRETGIEVRVVFEGDTCTILVTAEVPQNFRKGRSDTEHLWRVNQIIEDNGAHKSILTAQDDGFRVMKGRQWGTEKYEFDHHLWFPFVLGVLECRTDQRIPPVPACREFHAWRVGLLILDKANSDDVLLFIDEEKANTSEATRVSGPAARTRHAPREAFRFVPIRHTSRKLELWVQGSSPIGSSRPH